MLTLNDLHHTFVTIGGGVHERSTQGHGRGTQTQGLDDVGAPPHPTVEENVHLAQEVRVEAADLEEGPDGAGGVVALPAAVVAEVDGVDAVVVGERGVLGALDALEHDGAVVWAPGLPDPGQVVPVERGRVVASQRRTVLGRLWSVPLGQDGVVSRRGGELGAVPFVVLALAHHGRVDGDDERLVPVVPGRLDQLQGPGFLVGHVQLEPELAGVVAHLGRRGRVAPGELVVRHGRVRAGAVGDAGPGGAAGDAQLAVLVDEPGARGGRDEEGQPVPRAEHRAPHVDAPHVAHDPRPERHLLPVVAVVGQRAEVVGARAEVHPCGVRDDPLRGLFDVVEVHAV